MSVIEADPGLSNVSVAHTEIGDVRGEEGFYQYRQFSAIDLARHRTFEEVWFLFVYGRLPDAAELAEFSAEVRSLRAVDDELMTVIRVVATTGSDHRSLIDLRTVLSALGQLEGMSPLWDSDESTRARHALRVSAVTPTILAALHRLSTGVEPMPARADLDTAAHWLYSITGEVPAPEYARAVEQYLIATIDHGFNASTFTARVIASSGADLVSAICGAIGAFSGPLHGGAPDRALDALDEIVAAGGTAAAGEWAREQLASGRRIMGFGHAVYRTVDPRSELLREIAIGLGGELVYLAVDVEREVVAVLEQAHPDRPLYANVEFYAGVVMDRCGIPRSMFTPTFTVSRVVGWCSNVLEQAQSRRIIRPRARYVGPDVVELVR
ncbi:citrate/2-methylcitrate synthase [Williamsia maris]|uniref:Citrate synthase n=1 Tax=Williamsia maris TaxID=72806 RepID=A0ABT1HIJ3_9NOCA|nr:citrate/2-methylcitrate synthase [Williamsia maris]MCP2177745.1 citrate synthase [Williamsia maris]